MTCPTAGRRRLPSLALCIALALATAAGGGCGKKGAPLAPLVVRPAAPDQAAVRARGNYVSLQFRVPDANADNTKPADVARVDVYGYTGPPVPDEDLVELGTRVASVPVQRPRDPDEQPAAADEPAPAVPPGTFSQGDVVVVREELGDAQRLPVTDRRKKGVLPPPPAVAPPLQPPSLSTLPTRLYAAVAVSRKGRRGPFSEKLSVPLVEPPSRPPAPLASHDEKAIALRWVAPDDLKKPTILPPGDDEEVLPAKAIGMPAVNGGYNVYLAEKPDADGQGPDAWGLVAARRGPIAPPLNAALLVEPRFEDPAIEFGKERCYVVRSVSVFGPFRLESEASPLACLTPADTFAPAAPRGPAAVASEGSISLIWEASAEADLQGYLVLRAEGAGELRAITAEPIKETTYRDAQVKAGVRYTYAVVAVDTAGNRSEPSARIEETAR